MKKIAFVFIATFLNFSTLSATEEATELKGVRYKIQNTQLEGGFSYSPLIKNRLFISAYKLVMQSDSLSKNLDAAKTDPYAMAGLILSMAGLIFLLPILGSILGIICSSLALSRIRKNPEKYKGIGIATMGWVLGIVGLFIPIVYIILLIS